MEHLAHNLLDTAARHPDRVAVKLDDLELSYGELASTARDLGDELSRRGLSPGDRIAIVLANLPAYPVVFYGAQLADLVVVPINPMSKAREIRYFLEDSEASIVFAHRDTADEVRAGADDTEVWLCDDHGPLDVPTEGHPNRAALSRGDDQTAVILYTSGTTGRSKGAELTHRNLLTNATTTAQVITTLDANDVIMGCLPLFHSFGLTCAMNAAISTGACLTLLPRFDPDRALEVMQRDQVTVFAGVPTMYSALLNCPSADKIIPSLRSCISGGAPLPVELIRAFEVQFDCIILEGYGLSETSPAASFNTPSIPRKPGTVGPALPGVEMRVLDEHGRDVADGAVGEIVIRGENLMRGYWRRPDATQEAIPDTWFRSGDLGTRDPDGYYTIVDRKKDMIIRGGYNVYPREVEEVLYEHPDVIEAAVVGVPHPELGQEIAAAVSLRQGSTTTAEEIRDFVRGELSAYKYPREIWLLDSLPKGPTGKILRREIRSHTHDTAAVP